MHVPALLLLKPSDHVPVLRVLNNDSEALPPLLHAVEPPLLVVVITSVDLRMLLEQVEQALDFLSLLLWKHNSKRLISVKGAPGALLNKIWIHNFPLNATTHDIWVKIITLA